MFIVSIFGAESAACAHPAQVVACNALPDALITIFGHVPCYLIMSVSLMKAVVAVDMVRYPTILQ